MTTQTSQGATPRDLIVEKSRQVVLGYDASRAHWNTAVSLSALLRQMQREYEGRFLYELIQNAYDAHRLNGGRIAVLLDLDEDDHGVLYVANTGAPFTEDNFHAICELAQSDKTPDESIGNKGVGFKSVLQICEWPEIYSARELAQEQFEGFCFTFTRPEDYGDLTDGDHGLTHAMREDVAPYFLPRPLDEQAPHVRAFARQGMATVIRLPLRSAAARAVATERVERLVDEDVPVQLFLERLDTLEITLHGGGLDRGTTLHRDATPIDDPRSDPDQRYEHVDLGDQGTWFVTNRRMAAEHVRSAIAESIAAGELDESWASWGHDVWVSVAVRADGLEVRPRLYTFLPMEAAAGAPLHGHIHAPFSTMLARTSVSETVVLNARLLDCAARAATEAILSFSDHDDTLPAVALVDLVAWDEHHHERVTQSFSEAGADPNSILVVPIEPLPDGRRRGSFGTSYHWPHPELALLNRARLARDASAELISGAIADARLSRLDRYCRAFFDVGFKPNADTRAGWIEVVAAALHDRGSAPRSWDRFYSELADVFERDADALRGREVLLGDDGDLHSSPPEDDDAADRPLVFFPAARERTDEDDEVEADVDLRPPASLRRTLVLMSEDLTWTRQEGRRRRSTAARRFLEENKLVRRFKTVDLLEHVGRALTRSSSKALSSDALRFAFSLFVASRSVGQKDLRALDLRVPTPSGWVPARTAFFSTGWETPLAASLTELIDRGAPRSHDLAALQKRLLHQPDEWPTRVDDNDRWRTFLVDIGVRDGLWPAEVRHGSTLRNGSAVLPGPLAARLGLSDDEAQRWVDAVTTAPEWQPTYPNTPYRLRGPLTLLPGQADYPALDRRARLVYAELVVAGLQNWGIGALVLTWHRPRHARTPDDRRWPSPIAVFLRDTDWLPVSHPGDRRDEAFVTPGDAWHFAGATGEEPPNFSPLVAFRVRRVIAAASRALARLRQFGLGDWTEPEDAPRLLRHLARLVEIEAISETGALPFRRAHEAAWSRAAGLDLADFLEQADDLPLVVSRGGDLGVVRQGDDLDARVYLMGDDGTLAARVVEASDLPVLSVAEPDEPAIRSVLEPLWGERLRTVDELEIDVITDTGSFSPDGGGDLLVEGERAWFEALVALVLEARRSRIGQLGPRRRREVLERLLRVRRVLTNTLALRIDGVDVVLPERHRNVVPLDDERHPTLVVVPDRASAAGAVADLLPIARSACELLGIVQYEDQIQLALERLAVRGSASPTDVDLAAVLELDVERVAAIRAHLGRSLDMIVWLIAPVVAYHCGAQPALALLDERDSMDSDDDLRTALTTVAPDVPEHDRLIAASRAAESLPALRDALGLDYERFNAALQTLGLDYAPIHNPEGHRQAVRFHVEVHRAEVLRDLRSRYVSAFRRGEALDAYVAARDLAIDPDPAWLDAYDVPPEEEIRSRVLSWLGQHGTPTVDAELPDVDQARSRNHGMVTTVAEAAGSVVPAWGRKQQMPLPDLWAHETYVTQVTSAAAADGFLDFDLLDEQHVIAWLDAHGWWPASMPRTVDPDTLDLSDADLETEADVRERERQERLRLRRVVRLDDVEFSTASKAYADIYAHVTKTLRPDLLSTSHRRRQQLEMPAGGTRGSTARGGAGGRRREPGDGLSDAQKSAVGLVGESIAYAWLQQQYPDSCSPGSWVSTYREAIGEPAGNDILGYDFVIALARTTLYFEVKATTGNNARFDLGESEVGKAAECARRRNEDYRIIFITNALDAEARALHLLRNPMDPKHQRFYRFPGAGLVCTFNLA